jgi:hypothetical protein
MWMSNATIFWVRFYFLMRDFHSPELMFLWTPIMDDFDVDVLPSKSPREALQPLVDEYRGLRYVIKPPRGAFGHELFLEEEVYLRPYDGPEDRREESEAMDREILAISRGIRELYVGCGWDVDSVEQGSFRRGEFIERREAFLAGFDLRR